VSDRTYVYVGLRALKFLFSHGLSLL